VAVLLAVFALGAFVLWENNLRRLEHEALLHSHDLMTCVLTMTQPERDEFRKRYAPGSEKFWCPWLHEGH
jgi:hypothetical protein